MEVILKTAARLALLFLYLLESGLAGIDHESNPCYGLATGTTLWNAKDCSNSYLYCNDEGLVEKRYCEDIGYLYNPDVGRCDHWSNIPEWARCSAEGVVEEEDAEFLPDCDFTTTPYYVAHPTDCSKYFICNWGYASKETCAPQGQWWNCQTEKCVSADEVPGDCECRNPPVTQPPSSTETATASMSTMNSTSTTAMSISTESSTETSMESSTPTISSTESSTTETSTESSTPTISSTESSTGDPITSSTDLSSTDTVTDSTPSPPPPEYSDICYYYTETYSHYPENCSLYILCAGGQPHVYSCWGDSVYDDKEERCRPLSDVDPNLLKCTEPVKPTCAGGATASTAAAKKNTFPDPFSCRRYFTCLDDSNSEPQLIKCGHGPLLFDPPKGVCVLSEELSGPTDVEEGQVLSRCYQAPPFN